LKPLPHFTISIGVAEGGGKKNHMILILARKEDRSFLSQYARKKREEKKKGKGEETKTCVVEKFWREPAFI